MKRRSERAGDIGTRQRILLAALEEFSTNGYSGARIDRITRNADVNVRMIYHFFGNKKGLLDAVLAQIFQERQETLVKAPESMGELIESYFASYTADQHRVRLLEWEALENGSQGTNLNTFDDRQKAANQRMKALARLQQTGRAPAGIDTEMLFLFCVALTIYPMSFPQSVYVATGEDAYSESFRKRYREALASLADLMTRATQPASK